MWQVIVYPKRGRQYLWPSRKQHTEFEVRREAMAEAEKQSNDDSVDCCDVVNDASEIVATYRDGVQVVAKKTKK